VTRGAGAGRRREPRGGAERPRRAVGALHGRGQVARSRKGAQRARERVGGGRVVGAVVPSGAGHGIHLPQCAVEASQAWLARGQPRHIGVRAGGARHTVHGALRAVGARGARQLVAVHVATRAPVARGAAHSGGHRGDGRAHPPWCAREARRQRLSLGGVHERAHGAGGGVGATGGAVVAHWADVARHHGRGVVAGAGDAASVPAVRAVRGGGGVGAADAVEARSARPRRRRQCRRPAELTRRARLALREGAASRERRECARRARVRRTHHRA